MDDAAATARRLWALYEPVHVVTYFTSEARSEFEQTGLRGFWRGYFAGRAAPLGPVGAAPVTAAFFVFAPAMVSRALPGVWDMATPQVALQARLAGAVAAIRRLIGLGQADAVPAPVATAADLLNRAATDLDFGGRPLATANTALPVPAEPLARLWHAATLLREHRGDGHVACLVSADIDGTEALALRAGVDLAAGGRRSHVVAGWTREQVQPARGWTDDEWDQAAARLADRRLLDGNATATPAGVALHREIEHATDLAAARPWTALGAQRVADMADLLAPISHACAAAMPVPNPMGVPTSADGAGSAGRPAS